LRWQGRSSALKENQAVPLPDHLKDLPADERHLELGRRIQAEVSQIFALASLGEIPWDRPLKDFGLDSLLAIELRNRLAGLLGRSLPATLAFDYPTIARQADFILGEVLQLSPAPPEGLNSDETNPDSLLENLSEEEMEAVLKLELTRLESLN
jgi:hypothetical protein